MSERTHIVSGSPEFGWIVDLHDGDRAETHVMMADNPEAAAEEAWRRWDNSHADGSATA